MFKDSNGLKKKIETPRVPPNQPMERTPPCCALRRRSSAR